jgi:hypothetical protein
MEGLRIDYMAISVKIQYEGHSESNVLTKLSPNERFFFPFQPIRAQNSIRMLGLDLLVA